MKYLSSIKLAFLFLCCFKITLGQDSSYCFKQSVKDAIDMQNKVKSLIYNEYDKDIYRYYKENVIDSVIEQKKDTSFLVKYQIEDLESEDRISRKFYAESKILNPNEFDSIVRTPFFNFCQLTPANEYNNFISGKLIVGHPFRFPSTENIQQRGYYDLYYNGNKIFFIEYTDTINGDFCFKLFAFDNKDIMYFICVTKSYIADGAFVLDKQLQEFYYYRFNSRDLVIPVVDKIVYLNHNMCPIINFYLKEDQITCLTAIIYEGKMKLQKEQLYLINDYKSYALENNKTMKDIYKLFLLKQHTYYFSSLFPIISNSDNILWFIEEYEYK